METTLAATSALDLWSLATGGTQEVAGTTAIGTSVHSNFAIRCPMSIVVVTHVVVAHVTLVVHHPCASVVHRSIVMSHCRSRCGLVHVCIV